MYLNEVSGGFVIPPGQEALLSRMLGRPLPGGLELASARVERSVVLASFRGAGAGLEVRLERAELGGVGPTAGRVRVVVEAGEPSEAQLDALVEAIAAHEAALEWVPATDDLGGPGAGLVRDAERWAVVAGVKPALRRTVGRDEADAVMRRLERDGLRCARLGRATWLEGGGRDIVYAAREAITAVELRELEAALLSEIDARIDPARNAALNRELGARLGYPGCCVDAFCDRLRRLGDGAVGSPRYEAARDAWVARPSARLNDQLRAEGLSLVSFEPCRYDCEAARGVADRVAGALADVHAPSLAAIDELLRRDVVVEPGGAVAWARVSEGRVRDVEPWGGGAAPRVAGCAVTGAGRVADGRSPAPLLLSFGSDPGVAARLS